MSSVVLMLLVLSVSVPVGLVCLAYFVLLVSALPLTCSRFLFGLFGVETGRSHFPAKTVYIVSRQMLRRGGAGC